MEKLKPCPCCGGAAHMITRQQIAVVSGDDGFLSTIKCLGGGDCGLEVPAWALKKAWAIESVTKKWNRRVNEEVPRWIPVTERLPELTEQIESDDYCVNYSKDVLIWSPMNMVPLFEIARYTDGMGWTDPYFRRIKFQETVTHWMPLPKTPDLT